LRPAARPWAGRGDPPPEQQMGRPMDLFRCSIRNHQDTFRPSPPPAAAAGKAEPAVGPEFSAMLGVPGAGKLGDGKGAWAENKWRQLLSYPASGCAQTWWGGARSVAISERFPVVDFVFEPTARTAVSRPRGLSASLAVA